MASAAQLGVAEFLPAQDVRWNPALEALPLSGIRRMFNLAATMEDVIHLSIGQPDFPTPAHIIEAYVEALRAGKTGYTLDAGLPDLLAALADYYSRRYGRTLSPDHLLETTGASEGIFLAITSVARPGREVVIIEPSFILFEPLARFAGASVRRVVTTAAQGYQVDPQAVIDAMGPKTAAVILNSPGNPTGVVYPRETLEVICAEAQRRGITVISDEVYDHMLLDDPHYDSALRLAPDLSNLLVVSSLSKTYSMPGLRVGWIISSPQNIQTLRRYHMFTTTVGSTPAQWAGVAALRGDRSSVDTMVAEYSRRRDLVVKRITEIPEFTGYRPQGGFFVMPSLPAGADSEDIALRMLQETGVCTVPGNTFGESCRNALRISYATTSDKIDAAFDRMAPWLAKQSF